MIEETIVAIATPTGRGGIGIVRLSGPRSREIALPLLQIANVEPHRALFTRVVDAAGEVLDEAVVTYFAAPHSYTSDDVVEISMHGAPVLLEWVVAQCLQRGARVARAGEFTERAFLSGRFDLTQAEAVRDLIDSTTLEQARVAAQQLGGSLARIVQPVKAALVRLIGVLEAGIDFAEDDLDVAPQSEILQQLDALQQQLGAISSTWSYGRTLREGITLAIVGKPNAGKSSLFNRLIRRDRAIVTATPGTTRDLVTETFSLDGIPVHLVDTAGLRSTDDEAEAIGVRKSREALADADLVLVVLDTTTELSAEERELLANETLQPRSVVVRNKCDLAPALTDGADHAALAVSALTGDGLDTLRKNIRERVTGSGAAITSPLTNLRQQQAVQQAETAVAAAESALQAGLPHEVLLVDLYAALTALDELTGQTTADDILNLIFSSFCIGK